jgi:predicted transcriptional regulator
MADKKKPADDKSPAEVLSELMNVPFPNTAYLESMKRVFALQKHMLDNFQANLDQWFERRRSAAEATLDMLKAMNGENDQEKRAEAWQRWVSGAMARIMDDVQTQYDMMAKITSQLAEKGEVAMPPELKSVKQRPLNGKSGHHVPKKTAPRVRESHGPRTTN